MIKIIEIIIAIESIVSFMSFLFGGQCSTDKILSAPALLYIFKVLFPVWAGINYSVSN